MNHYFIVPEVIYILLLLCSWIAAMFSGIAFVYSIHMKKQKQSILPWAGIFAICLIMVFLLMNGVIVSDNMIG
ncbi:MAG: hypothetical protein Q4C06_01025 [Bacillota bacterium]|nr:hypothetical protein [Bacillota bacterium]